MSYLYTAVVAYRDSNGRFANLTEAPTVTAVDLSGNSIPNPTITNLATGVYKVAVTQDDLEDVIFKIVPAVANQGNFEDVAVMQDKVYHVADEIYADTPSLVWAYASRTLTQSASEILASVSGTSITAIRGNTWDIEITGVTLDANKQQFAIKYTNLDTDAESILLIDSITGLIYLNGAPATDPTAASLSYIGTTLKIKVDASIAAQLPTGIFPYGIQSITVAGVVVESYSDTFTIISDTVRAVT